MDFLNGASATLERAALGNRKLVERERDAKRRSAEPEGKLGAAVRPASGRPPSVASSAVIRGRRQSQTGSRPPHARRVVRAHILFLRRCSIPGSRPQACVRSSQSLLMGFARVGIHLDISVDWSETERVPISEFEPDDRSENIPCMT